MAVSKRLIANSQDLSDGGTGVRFLAIDDQGVESPAFVIRHRGGFMVLLIAAHTSKLSSIGRKANFLTMNNST